MEEIDIIELFKIFWKKKIQIMLIVLIFIGIGYVYTTKYVKPRYTSSTTLVLASENEQNENNTLSTAMEVTINSKLVSTYTELIKSNNVLEESISNLDNININVEELKENIFVTSENNTSLIELNVTNENPEDASKIANEISNVFIKKISEIYNLNNVQVVDEAEIPTSPSNIHHKKDIILFALVGVAISAVYVIMANILDTTVKSADELERMFDVPILASIPINRTKKSLIVHKNPKSPISEVFRTLRTNIQFMNSKKTSKVMLITSTVSDEGKSWVASNLAVTFAQTGKTVLLIDADMRKGIQYNIFGISPKSGLSNYLSGIGSNLEDKEEIYKEENYIQETNVENLYMITAGDIPPNPSELLISPRMSRLLGNLREMYDIIIIDGTPCELVTDSLVLIKNVDTIIVVTAYKQTKKDSLKKVIESIKNLGGENIGCIFNKVPISVQKYEDSFYYESINTKKKAKHYSNNEFKTLSKEKENKIQKQMKETESYRKKRKKQ